MTATVVVGLALGLGVTPAFEPMLRQAAFWYIGLFAFGMAGAVIGFSEEERIRAWREKIPFGMIAAVAWAVIAGGLLGGGL